MLKFWNDIYRSGNYDIGRLQDENLRETFQEQLKSTTREFLKFDNVEDGWNIFRKIHCEVADSVIGKKVKNAARNISEKALSVLQQ